MAKLLPTLCSPFNILLILQLVSVPLVRGQANSTFVDQSGYSTFELFKNTGLQPCPVNYTAASVNALVPREPRRGGGGGGGTRGGGTTDPLFASDWAGSQAGYCKHMTGIPIMIPTLPTQNAFTPWWPTFTLQFVSLLFTWLGLWWTTRSVERNAEVQDMSLPVTFWIQLPIDLARIVAWFVRTSQGLVDATRFSWVSVILWLVPFNYIWLTRLLGSKTQDYAPVLRQETNRVGVFTEQAQPLYENSGSETKHTDFQSVTETATHRIRPRMYWASMAFAVVTIVQWCMSLAVVALHFKYSWLDKGNHPTYVETPRAVSNPSSIARMPQSCLDWLEQSSDLVASKLLDMKLVQVLFTLINAFQFVVCTLVVLFSTRSRYRILGKLKISAWASLLSLGLPALGTGIWIIAKVAFGNQDIWITYTHNTTTTGGCTFAAVTMDRQWGYWDVQYNLPVRIAMSALGVA
ncbi:hypothetical protein C7974DRAFT_469733 [Boeremia exigua]|uniref:uncharacterized protein n=1 Tax=Boeremia exigua TaxID=749465 RepID=UPI001E8E95A2|nr:uncharacterized protein C7974DRAFT_469733 [Boeremia exigua]KAH6639143.1 hypothetical protein C7974DRAFT_469733 [Boeremia exigua]